MKTILITGGSSGIGKATALQFASEGDQVIIVGRNEARLQQTKNGNIAIECIQADIATEEGRLSIKDAVADRSIDILINNAGLMTPSGSLDSIDVEPWRYQMSVNIEAPLFLSQLLLSNLKNGRILNLTIYSSFRVTPGLASYGISKAALNQLTEYMRAEYAIHNIDVGLALPGIVNTNIQNQLPKNSQAKDIEKLEPKQVAKFIAWVTSKAPSDKFNQEVIDIYDGWHQSEWHDGMDLINPLQK